MELRDAIQRIALEWPCYGRPRITQELRRPGMDDKSASVG
jgi:putative transposase